MRESRFFDPAYLSNEKLKARKKKGIEYLNAPAAFDIETSSFYEGEEKRACLYAFVFGLNGKVIFGRTWEDFINILYALRSAYGLDPKARRLIVYVHNLGYEFQFLRKLLKWESVFASDDRKPLKAVSELGLEFRDSYILSGLGLERTAKNLTKYKIDKLSGALDYKKVRHSETVLTPQEWHYIENDGLSLMAFIQEEIERNDNNITRIPLTNTGYVRNLLRAECYHGGNKGHGERRKVKDRSFGSYGKLMRILTLTPTEYLEATEAFQGGFTHANNFNVGLIFENVHSMDLTSAYPATLVLDDGFPMGRGTYVKAPTSDFFSKALKFYACVFRVRIWGISSAFKGDSMLSASKCRNVSNASLDNGRVLEADYLETTLTNIDLEIIRAFYHIERIEPFDLWYYPRGYLPKPMIKGVLKLYADKTTLKGVEGEEANYMHKKGMLNSCYGCSVTNVIQENHLYTDDDEWGEETPNVEEEIEKYNNSKNRFLFYLWGIFVTAHVRKTIARAILVLGDDYIYSDTDSVKFLNLDLHKHFFDEYNENIKRKIAKSSDRNGLPIELFQPKTKEGEEKPIGVFDYEGSYKRFKTLGAKRYFVEFPEKHKIGKTESEYSLTISGVNKGAAIPALIKKAEEEGKDIFDFFEIGFEFDVTMAGKNVLTYIDEPQGGAVVDYKGLEGSYSEQSFIHMEETTYKLTTTEEFLDSIIISKLERIERRTKRRMS